LTFYLPPVDIHGLVSKHQILKEFSMLKKMKGLIVFAAAMLLFSCAKSEDATEAASMEDLYKQNGSPVTTRRVAPEAFSTYLKYSTVLAASSESVAYAMVSDVVRSINKQIGDRVERNEIVISFSTNNPNYQQARLTYDSAKSSFDRVSALYASADVSRQDFDNAKTQYDLAASGLEAVTDMVYAKAPIAGTITSINVHVTENVQPGMPLFTVSGGSGFEGRFYVGSDEIDRIKTGARVFIEKTSQPVEGRVTQVSLIMDGAKQAFPVSAVFPVENGGSRDLVSGMGVDLAVETYRNEKAIVVSRRELVKTGSGYTAYISVDNVAMPVAIQIGREQGLKYEIAGGLREGDLLISEGIQRLSDGMSVNITNTLAAGKK
jgi:RND family efflux transporter MFP subunit